MEHNISLNFDLTKGFWQISVLEAESLNLAFFIPDGQYQWRVMPFGFFRAPAVSRKKMRLLIEPMRDESVSNFMDDILVANLEEHIRVLHKLFQHLKRFNFTVFPTQMFLWTFQT